MQVYGTVDGSVWICVSKANDILAIVFTFVLGSFLKGKWSFQVSQGGQQWQQIQIRNNTISHCSNPFNSSFENGLNVFIIVGLTTRNKICL